jgi:GNAT superfamily N-acetyltransferase
MTAVSDLDIVRFDPADDDLLDDWHAIAVAAQRHAVGDAAAPFTLDELRAVMRQPATDLDRSAWLVLAGAVPVASGFIGLPLLDNLTSARIEVSVAPEAQGRGHGRAVLAHLEAVVADAGRTLLDTEVRWPYEHGTDGREAGGSRDLRFAEAAGYRLGLSDVQRRLDLPVDDAVLDALAAEAAPHHAGYEQLSWVGDVPDDLAPSWVALDSSLTTEAPTGDLEVEAPVADVERLRRSEDVARAQGRTAYHSVALTGSGVDRVVVAYTQVVVDPTGRAYQWGTLVQREHRGHRLGLSVKVANLRLLQRERPDVVLMDTWNAEVNDHMIGINDRLGFRPVSRMGGLQKRLPS